MVTINTEDLFQIGELSEKAGVSKRTIRYYEERGLLSPTRVTSGGFRLYSVNDLQVLQVIKYFKKLDFSLEEIKDILQPLPGKSREEKIKYSREVLKQQQKALEEKIENLQEVKERNADAIKMLDQCQECALETCPLECANRNAYLCSLID